MKDSECDGMHAWVCKEGLSGKNELEGDNRK